MSLFVFINTIFQNTMVKIVKVRTSNFKDYKCCSCIIVAYKVFATEGYVCDVCVPEWVGYKGTYDFKEKS